MEDKMAGAQHRAFSQNSPLWITSRPLFLSLPLLDGTCQLALPRVV